MSLQVAVLVDTFVLSSEVVAQVPRSRSCLAEVHPAGQLDWSKAVIDSVHVRALKGSPKRGRARSPAYPLEGLATTSTRRT